MRRLLPSLRLTLNLNYKVLLGLTFFFLHIACLKIHFLKLFVYLCMYFLFLVLSSYYALLSLDQFCYSTLPRHLAIVALPCCLPHFDVASYCHSTLLLLWTPPCCCYELHLATPMNSTLLWLQAPPCCIFCLAIVPPFYYYSTIVITLPTFLPCCVAIQPYCFSTFTASLLALGINGLTWNSYCCIALLSFLCLATIDCFLCLPSWYIHNSLFPSRFWFLELEETSNNKLK